MYVGMLEQRHVGMYGSELLVVLEICRLFGVFESGNSYLYICKPKRIVGEYACILGRTCVCVHPWVCVHIVARSAHRYKHMVVCAGIHVRCPHVHLRVSPPYAHCPVVAAAHEEAAVGRPRHALDPPAHNQLGGSNAHVYVYMYAHIHACVCC